MEYRALNGYLMALLIQHCISEGLSSSAQPTTAGTLPEEVAVLDEAELPSAEVVPVVVPPSLEEVHQAVQEASEQVEGRGAEMVLKELLERVVEAALGQVEGGGGGGKEDEAGEEEMLGAREEESEVDTEEAEEGQVVSVSDSREEEEEVEDDLEAHEDQSEEGAPGGEADTAAEPLEANVADVGTGGGETEEVQLLSEPLDDIVEGTAAVLEEAATAEETWSDTVEQQVEPLGARGEVETINREQTLFGTEEAGGSDSDVWDEKVSQASPTPVEEAEEGDANIASPKNVEVEPVQTYAAGSLKAEEETNVAVAIAEKEEQNILVGEGGAPEGTDVEETSRTDTEEATEMGDATDSSLTKEESVASHLEEQVGQQEEEEQAAVGASHGGQKEDQEMLLISDPKPEESVVSIEQSVESQVPTTSLSLGGGEDSGENNPPKESKGDNEIITPVDDLVAHDTATAQPTLDNFVKDPEVKEPEVIGEEPGEVKELMEDTAESLETNELSLEAWKIGAIFATVFLALETMAVLIYLIRRRDKNSAQAAQRTCEEGGVEPEAATGGDCNDDTLIAGNRDTQSTAALDPSDVASTLAQNNEQHEGDGAITMSNLSPPSSAEETSNAGIGPDSSQDFRTSSL